MEQPSYYAVIPANVRYADIPPNAKLLYGEITALTSKEGYCWASNEHFAKLYGVDKGTVSRWVSDLEEKGFIAVSLEKNYLRKITLTQKAEGGIGKNAYPPRQKPEESIKVITKENTSVAIAPHIEVVEEETKVRKPRDDFEELYAELCDWAEARRKAKFVHRIKQYTALKKARTSDIGPAKLKKRWTELENEEWYQTNGLDWASVVSSFNKRP